jgi:dipeptidyl aminopeptidase/acylaminoacyl peptidase
LTADLFLVYLSEIIITGRKTVFKFITISSSIILLLSLVTFTTQAAGKQLPLNSYSKLPEISMMRISPDGSQLAYRSNNGKQDVFVVKDAKTGKIQGAINVSSIDPQLAYFIDNEKIILKASQYKNITGYKGMHHVSSAFIFNIADKEIRQLLTPGYGIYTGQTSLGDITGISEDKSIAYMPAYIGDEGIKHHEPQLELTQVSLDKKRKPRSLRKGTHDTINFFVDSKGNVIARERYNNKTDKHLVQSQVNGEWVDIFSEETKFRYRNFPGITPDKKSLVMTVTGENGHRNYYTISLTDGTISEAIFSKKDADVEYVFTDIQKVVYGVRYSGFKPSYEFFDKKLTKTIQLIQQAMPNNVFYLEDKTEDWSKIIFRFEGEMAAGTYLLYENGGFSYLASQYSAIPAEQVYPIKEYSYQARDGLTIPTLLTYPTLDKTTGKNLPAIIMPHGGPESYDRIEFNWLAQYFANRGFVVIQPQFRGSKGFGIDHILKGRGEWGQKMQDDLTDAVTALSDEGVIDHNNVCIVGWSYGGYAALAGATYTPDLYKCAISINGVSDVEEMLDEEKDNYGSDSEILSYWKEVINKNKLSDDFLQKISPINYVENIKIPVLIIHGTRDKVVPVSQSEDFFDKMEDANKEVSYLELKGVGHSILDNTSRLKMLQAIDSFLQKNMM